MRSKARRVQGRRDDRRWSAASEAGFDAAVRGFVCSAGVCAGCTAQTVLPASATGDPNVEGFGESVAVSGSTLLVGANTVGLAVTCTPTTPKSA
jgi:hypothetical protein